MTSHYAELKVIFAADNEMCGRLVNKLITEAYEISRDYAKRFNSDFATGLKGVAPTVARTFGRMSALVATVATSAVSTGLGYIKVSEASDDFTEKFDRIISNMAKGVSLRTKVMMQNKLEYSFEGHGERIMKMLGDQSFITGQDIDYQHCYRITEFDFGDVENLRDAITAACEKNR